MGHAAFSFFFFWLSAHRRLVPFGLIKTKKNPAGRAAKRFEWETYTPVHGVDEPRRLVGVDLCSLLAHSRGGGGCHCCTASSSHPLKKKQKISSPATPAPPQEFCCPHPKERIFGLLYSARQRDILSVLRSNAPVPPGARDAQDGLLGDGDARVREAMRRAARAAGIGPASSRRQRDGSITLQGKIEFEPEKKVEKI